jgi:hypothetical protein
MSMATTFEPDESIARVTDDVIPFRRRARLREEHARAAASIDVPATLAFTQCRR